MLKRDCGLFDTEFSLGDLEEGEEDPNSQSGGSRFNWPSPKEKKNKIILDDFPVEGEETLAYLGQ